MTALMRYRNNHPATSLLEEMDHLTNRFLGGLTPTGGLLSSRSTSWMPAVDVEETEESVVLTADLPGFRTDDIEVQVEGRILSISGTRSESRDEGDASTNGHRVHVRERSFGSFQRSFSLPSTVNGQEIEASFEDGVLTVHMPKAPEAKGRRIPVLTGTKNGKS